MPKIVQGCNFDGDYPDEKFVTGLPNLPRERLQLIADCINQQVGEHHDRYYRVVEDDYQLSPGFEP